MKMTLNVHKKSDINGWILGGISVKLNTELSDLWRY
jgi:hypothetical protein